VIISGSVLKKFLSSNKSVNQQPLTKVIKRGIIYINIIEFNNIELQRSAVWEEENTEIISGFVGKKQKKPSKKGTIEILITIKPGVLTWRITSVWHQKSIGYLQVAALSHGPREAGDHPACTIPLLPNL
jgi:hypothetical protein